MRLKAPLLHGLALVRRVGAQAIPKIRTLPSTVLAAAAGLAVVLAMLAVVAVFRKGASVRVPTADGGFVDRPQQPLIGKLIGPPKAPSEALSAAVVAGAPALEELSARYARDPAVLKALLRVLGPQKRHMQAMETVGKLSAMGDDAVEGDDVHDAVLAAAAGPPEAADAAFALMEGALGAKGADLLYELVTSKGLSPKLAQRVRSSAAKPEVKAHASAALKIAMDLRAAKTCAAKKALLSKAKDQGDARVLVLLRPMLDSKGCGFLGFGDCWPCMRADSALVTTVAALEEKNEGAR
jgi:hypothetical protein